MNDFIKRSDAINYIIGRYSDQLGYLKCTDVIDQINHVPSANVIDAEAVMRIVEYANQKAGDKTYIVLDDGSFCSQAKYIKEKVLELLDRGR